MIIPLPPFSVRLFTLNHKLQRRKDKLLDSAIDMDMPTRPARIDHYHDRYSELYPAHPGPRPRGNLQQPRHLGSGPIMPIRRKTDPAVGKEYSESSGSRASVDSGHLEGVTGEHEARELDEDEDEDDEMKDHLTSMESTDWAAFVNRND
jgi:hypothetical protein